MLVFYAKASIWCVFDSNESVSFDAIAKQTTYRYSAISEDIILSVHNFCKCEKEVGLKSHQIKRRNGLQPQQESARVPFSD